MNEFDELVARPGVLMAGRFGSDGRVAEHKSTRMYIENPAATAMVTSFCSAVTTMLIAMAAAIDQLNHSGGFDTTSCLPMSSWTYTGGDYTVAVYGDKFAFAETAKVKDLEEMRSLMLGLN